MDDAVMDDELLAPPGAEPAGPEAQWKPARGFSDSRRTVRLWLSEDQRELERVRISPRWRERLAGRTLDEACMEAFTMASIVLPPSAALQPPALPPREVGPNPSHEDLLEHHQRLIERLAELEARPAEQVRWADFVGEHAEGTVRGRATVRLSLAGITEHVAFDRRWLATAAPDEIASHLMAAHRAAVAHHVPPKYVPGEYEALAAELDGLARAVEAMFGKEVA